MYLVTNLSDVIRSIDLQKKAILKDIGDSIAEGIWEEFEILVQETPQYTGTTAASWNLYMYKRGNPGALVREQELAEGESPLSKGHQAAVDVARQANINNLANITEDYVRSDIMIANHAPGADVSESGEGLRMVNQPGGAFARFQARVATKLFKPVRDREI